MRWLLPLLLVSLLVGCTTTRVITITTKPQDATIKVDNIERGRGQLTESFVFSGKEPSHTVSVSRLGYREQSIPVSAGYDRDKLEVELRPLTRRVMIVTAPVPAVISIDGQPVGPDPVDSITRDLEFTVDAKNAWTTHVVSAERPGFERAEQTVTIKDTESTYTLRLEPRKKDILITTTPPGAQVFLENENIGTSPIAVSQRPFPVDTETGQAIPQRVRVVKAGYDPIEVKIGWDDGKANYSIPLIPKSKTVRIISDPPGALVMLGNKELPRDSSGMCTATLVFPPTNEKGELRSYTALVSKKTAETEWFPQTVAIGWDDGKVDYPITLKEVRTRVVPLVSPALERADEGWEVVPKLTPSTIAMKDVTEGAQKQPPVRLTSLPRGTQLDTLAISPDGMNLLFTVLYGTDRTNFRSQLIVVKTDGSQGADYLSDGKSLEITPAYWPDGNRIVFASNRAGRRLSVWSMSALGAPGITQLTTGDTNDLWPSVDNDPKPRLFYQASVDTRPDPRIYMTQLGTTTRTDLTQMGGSQPRVGPKADSIIFCSVNEKTGKRDIYVMPDRGGTPQNLTNTPDVDEFDPSWSRDGARITFVSDAGVDEERRRNYDIWALDIARPERPVQITTNGSWDDHPVWDPSGAAIYFRSNRGGEWAIWKISTK